MTHDRPGDASDLLQHAVAGMQPSPDLLAAVERRASRLRHRQRFISVATAVAAVVALLLIVPSLRTYLPGISPRDGTSVRAPSVAGGKGATTDSNPPAVTPNQPPANAVDWYPRGDLPVEGNGSIGPRAAEAWAQVHGIGANQSAPNILLGTRLPDGTSVLVLQMYQLVDPSTAASAHTVVYVEPGGKQSGRIDRDEVSPLGMQEISCTVRAGGIDYVIVVAPQSSRSLAYAADGKSFKSVTTLPGYRGGPGWAIFRAAPAQTASAIRVVSPAGDAYQRSLGQR